MTRAWLDDLVESLRDTLAYLIVTAFVGWLYAPDDSERDYIRETLINRLVEVLS